MTTGSASHREYEHQIAGIAVSHRSAVRLAIGKASWQWVPHVPQLSPLQRIRQVGGTAQEQRCFFG